MSIYDKASLVLIPSGTKTSKVYSQKPVSGDGDFTFSRSTAATRINADGNIEKETQNLLLQSNQFDTTWGKQNVTLTSGQSGYDGNDAWFIQSNTANGGHRVTQTFSTSGVYTFSVYAKAGGYNYLALYSAGQTQGRYFDLANGLVGNTMLGTPVDSKIESVGSGWYRCSVTFSGTEASIEMWMSESGSSYIFTGDGTSGVYIQDAQVEQGLVARDYIETTTAAVEGGITDNVPRLDYTDSSCPSLKLEPQRTNLITSSEALSIGTSGSTTEQNTADTTSPEGYYNATKILGSTSYLAKGVGSAFSGNNTTSVFLKYGNDSEVGVYMYDGAYYRVIFDLTDGTISSTFGGATGTITDYGNGWYRCTIYKSTAANVVEVGVDGLAGIVYTYGWQHEYNASYATSYIPTYGTSVTRNQDNCNKTGVSDLIGQTEGTLFLEFDDAGYSHTSIARGLAVSDGTYNNRLYISQLTTGAIYVVGVTNGTGDIELQEPAPASRSKVKAALAYKNNDCVLYVNGTQVATDTTATIPSTSRIDLGQSTGGGAKLYKPYNNVMLFKTRLSNEELADLTTL